MNVTVSGQVDMPMLKGGAAVIVVLDPGTHSSDAARQLAEHQGPRLDLQMHDVWFASERHIVPSEDHLQTIEAFLDAHRPAALHVSCLAGVSRSAALALFVLAYAHPEWSDEAVVNHVLRVRPQCFPNPLIVALADQRLGRHLASVLQEALSRTGDAWPPA